jgi:N-acetylglucosaminyldiphosphoundecaprenol N-acetyl-beta-D-mannosaminyltransferase
MGPTAAEISPQTERRKLAPRQPCATGGRREVTESAKSVGLPASLNVMGVRVTPFESYDHAVRCAEETIAAGRKSFWVAINPQKIHRAWGDPQTQALLDRADAGIADGIGVSVATKILYGITLRRCTGCDLFHKLIEHAAGSGRRVFLLGASAESNRLAGENLTRRFPGLQIVGQQDGFFKDDRQVVRHINDSGAEMLFVAMGSPAQERWIVGHMDQIDAKFFLGVGGSFDVISGTNPRAPKIMRKMGMEFVYQLVKQPWRWRRQIVYVPFMLRVLQARCGQGTGSRSVQ